MLVDTNKLNKSKDDIKLSSDNSKIYMYIVMPRYGNNLFKLFNKKNYLFTPNSIYSLGIQNLNILEQIQEAGFIFNDLKLDNILID